MKNLLKTVLQVLMLSVVYVIVLTVVTGILITAGFSFPETGEVKLTSLLQLVFAGLINSILVVYIVKSYSRMTAVNFFLIIFFILFFSNLSVSVEGNIFTPDLITNAVLTSLFFQQILVGFVFAAIATFINRKKIIGTDSAWISGKIIDSGFIIKLVAGSVSYMLLYYVFGRISYSFFTKSFYEMGQSGLSIPSGITLINYIFIRGIMITISILPFIKFAQPDNSRKKYETGMILFIFGGLIPLSLTIGIFPIHFILLSLAEIFLQNFVTGIVIYRIFTFKSKVLKVENLP